jgi:hypothetical protein
LSLITSGIEEFERKAVGAEDCIADWFGVDKFIFCGLASKAVMAAASVGWWVAVSILQTRVSSGFWEEGARRHMGMFHIGMPPHGHFSPHEHLLTGAVYCVHEIIVFGIGVFGILNGN